jgi:uncharacterized protein (TIGR02594 family)
MKAYADAYQHDSTPWCGVAAAWAVSKASIRPPKEYMASAAWRSWGYDIKTFEFGAIACLEGHVAFAYEHVDNTIYLLGGNQSDAVTIMPASPAEVLAWRWPAPEDYRTGYYPADDRKEE